MKLSLKAIFAAILCTASFPSGAKAQDRSIDLVFLGLMGRDAPAIETNFDRRIRDALSVTPQLRVADYQQSQEFRRRINFDENPVVSRKLVETLWQFTNDSTVFAWVVVKENSLKPVRQWLVRSAVEGDLTLTLTVYSLRFKDYTFIGDVHVSCTKSKDFIFFYPVEKGTHISALDRTEITAQLIDRASYRSAELISAVVRSEVTKSEKLNDTTEIEKRREQAISDMFKMPSVEPAAVEVGRKRPATSPGSATGSAPRPGGVQAPKGSPRAEAGGSQAKKVAPGSDTAKTR